MIIRRFGLCISICTAVLISSCATLAPPPKPPIEKNNFSYLREYLSWMLADEIKRNKLSGINIALVVKDQTIWKSSVGHADIKKNIPLSQETLFRAGSIAKLFNALAILHLVEQNLLDLDSAITHYLPEFKYAHADHSKITLRMLLSHQAGLPSDHIKGMWEPQPKNFKTSLNYLQTIHYPHPADKIFLYSNQGFNLVGAIIESVSGQDYEIFMHGLFNKMGLHNSVFSAYPSKPSTAKAYSKRKPKRELSLRDVPAAGLSTSTAELAKFLQALLTQQLSVINNSDSYKQIFSDYSSDKPLNFGKRVGLGIFYFDGLFHRKTPIFGHSGASVNHRSVIQFSMDQQYGVVLLSNDRNSSASLYRIANKAISLLHQATTGKAAPRHHVYWPKPTTEDIVEAKKFIGYFSTKAGMVKIYRHKNALAAHFSGKKFSLYQKQKGGLYYLRYKLFGLFPIKLGYLGNLGLSIRQLDGEEFLLATNTVGITTLLGKKIVQTNIPNAWKNRVGRYETTDPLAVIKLTQGGIKIQDGFLIAYARTDRGDKLEVVLQAVNDNEALVSGIGRGLGEYVYVSKKQNREQLIYSNIVFQKQK